jgi:quinol monooxygenase YgiN
MRSADMLHVPGPIVVIATMRAKPGQESQALEHRRRQVLETLRSDAGCSTYALHQYVGAPERLAIIQRWDSMRALADHSASQHSQRAMSELPDLLAAMPEITYMHPVPVGDSARGAL